MIEIFSVALNGHGIIVAMAPSCDTIQKWIDDYEDMYGISGYYVYSFCSMAEYYEYLTGIKSKIITSKALINGQEMV